MVTVYFILGLFLFIVAGLAAAAYRIGKHNKGFSERFSKGLTQESLEKIEAAVRARETPVEGRLVLHLPETLKPFQADILEGFEEFAHGKGYGVKVEAEDGNGGGIGYRVVRPGYTPLSSERILSDFEKFLVEALGQGEDFAVEVERRGEELTVERRRK